MARPRRGRYLRFGRSRDGPPPGTVMSEITLELEGQPLSPSLRSFSIREVVSRPFDVKLLARSEQVVADLEAFVGTGATFLARYDDGHGVPRELRVRGVCSMAQLLARAIDRIHRSESVSKLFESDR